MYKMFTRRYKPRKPMSNSRRRPSQKNKTRNVKKGGKKL